MKSRTSGESGRIEALVAVYGDGSDGAAPRPEQWRAVLEGPAAAPVTLINFFKLRDSAKYPPASGAAASTGQEAFGRYAAVSAPGLEKVGGRFLLLAPFEMSFIGNAEDWDFVAVGTYPSRDALLALFDDADYRQAFVHRTAACERQKVILCAG